MRLPTLSTITPPPAVQPVSNGDGKSRSDFSSDVKSVRNVSISITSQHQKPRVSHNKGPAPQPTEKARACRRVANCLENNDFKGLKREMLSEGHGPKVREAMENKFVRVVSSSPGKFFDNNNDPLTFMSVVHSLKGKAAQEIGDLMLSCLPESSAPQPALALKPNEKARACRRVANCLENNDFKGLKREMLSEGHGPKVREAMENKFVRVVSSSPGKFFDNNNDPLTFMSVVHSLKGKAAQEIGDLILSRLPESSGLCRKVDEVS